MPLPALLYFPILVIASLPGVLAIQITDTLNLGALIIALALSLATLVGILFGVKWKVAAETEKQAREAATALYHLKDGESKDLHEKLLAELRLAGEREKVIERLESLPNLERILNLMGDQYERLDVRAQQRLENGLAGVKEMFNEVMEKHDTRAEARTQKLIDAIRKGVTP